MTLIDPYLSEPIQRAGVISGTTASLGVLMGNVFRRSSGRAWRLRQRSMALWPSWINALHTQKHPLKLHSPLMQLAKSEAEASRMQELAEHRAPLGLERSPPNSIKVQGLCLPKNKFGGLISHHDGRVDPLALQECLRAALPKRSVKAIQESVLRVERRASTSPKRWRLHLASGTHLDQHTIVISAALGSEALLQPLGHCRPLEPILGQVLELEVESESNNWAGWPAVLVSHGFNLIPRDRNHLWIGATLEPGEQPDSASLKKMHTLEGDAPNWLKNASVSNHWHGLRGKPIDRPAPLLETLEPGLILATGHYRNGVLLAPATAEWVGEQLKTSS